MTGIPLRYVANVNPSLPELDVLPDQVEVTFLPLEAVWPAGDLDTTRLRSKQDIAQGYTRFRENDILIPKITPTFEASRTAIASGLKDGIGCGTTELHVVRPHEGVDSRYIYYLAHSRPFLESGKAEMVGVAGQKRVPEKWLSNFEVPIQDSAHQRAIADFLDAETARIDALITKKQQLIGRLQERMWQQRSWMVLGGNEAVESRGPLPLLKPAWSVRRIKHAVPRVGVGVVVNPSSYFAESGVPFLHGSDIRDGWVDQSNLKFISKRDSYKLWRSRLEEGDVVVVRAGYPGRAAVITSELADSNCASVLVLKKGGLVDPEFLAAFFNSDVARSQVKAAQYGAAQEQINVAHVVEFCLPVPPRREQDRIVHELHEMEGDVQQVARRLRRQVGLLQERRQALITAAVTGELEVPAVAA